VTWVALQAECEKALDLLAKGVAMERRGEFVGIVRDYIDRLERTADERGVKLKQVAEETLAKPGRPREVIGRFLDDGTIFLLQVPVYDLAWLSDLVTEQFELRLVLRPEEASGAWRGVSLTYRVIETLPQPGDFLLSLCVQSFGERDDGSGEVRFAVASFVIAGEYAPGQAPTSTEVTASQICDALARGVVRAEMRRTPTGVEVHFEDVR
jgi:hypothetical protein